MGDPTNTAVYRINVPLQPMHRGQRVSDPLDAKLVPARLGEVTGGATPMNEDWRIERCEVEVELSPGGDPVDKAAQVAAILTELGVPQGSEYEIDGVVGPISFGEAQCLEIELNGSTLAPEVYAAHDVNDLIDDLRLALRGLGELWSYDEHGDTSLYYVGESFEAMAAAAQPVLEAAPLGHGARLLKRA